MFSEKLFRRAVEDSGCTLPEVAALLGISIPTLYRKMSGESDFYRKEIQIIGDIVGRHNIKPIFFG